MIRINLLSPERQKVRKPLFTFDEAHRVAAGAVVIVLATAGGIGWWYLSLNRSSARIEADILTAQQEVEKLQPVLAEVQRAEQRRTQLQQRVSLIEQLRE
jgi:Tfp pilus assembly protein PilN